MNPESGDMPVHIRSFEKADAPACQLLYRDGLIGGKIADNDTGLDIDDINTAYMRKGAHFWVAQRHDRQVVGMVGVQNYEPGTAEIRRLRVCKTCQRRGIGTKLLETALKFCTDNGYIKVTLDTFIEREPAIRLFEKFRFKHSRSRALGERQLLYFYLDLYTGDH